jgi:DNA-binding CsgD family transcriptional regulator
MVDQDLPVADLLAQTRDVLALTEQALRVTGLSAAGAGDVHSADTALTAARGALADRLQVGPASGGPVTTAALAALILRAEQIQLSLRDALLAAQSDEIASAQEAVSHLRAAMSTAALAERIPVEACLMGFSRVLFSYVKRGTWIARSAFARDDREMAVAMVEAGATNPRRLAGRLVEGEMVRCGQPILVRNAQSDTRVHKELIAITKTTDYVAAPVFGWGRPIGLVHADRNTGDHVGDFDRRTLGIFAEGLGIAFERNLMIERLQALRRAADQHLRTANALADDFTLEVMDLAGPGPAFGERFADDNPDPPHGAGHDSRLLSELTARESEVLRAVAEGKTNAQIATALFVTEGTVKSHVKHILRKLGATNRTEAVAKYHHAQTESGMYSIVG